MRTKCEDWTRKMMSEFDPIVEFNSILEGKNWHRELNEKIANYVDRKKHSSQDVDELLMTTTKLVEQKLKDAIINRTGSSIPQQMGYGIRLNELALDCHLLSGKDNPLYHILSWFFREPRNISHHQFSQSPVLTLVMFVSIANYILNELEVLTRGQEQIQSNLQIRYNPQLEKVEFPRVTLTKTGRPLDPNSKVEILLTDPRQQVKTIQLEPSGRGDWRGDYDARGDMRGTFTASVRGISANGIPFTGISGSYYVRSFQVGQNCPHCGGRITHPTTMCPYCGRR